MGTDELSVVWDAEGLRDMRGARRIEYLSIAWASLEAVVGMAAGILAGSIALISFGADSIIEVASSGVLLWRLSNPIRGEHREELAHRLVGVSFLALAAYVCVAAVHDLIAHEAPRASYFGIIYAAACVIVMPLLAGAKRRASRRVKSNALHADSHQSDICAWLSVILLAGLALNALFDWWWADPMAALAMLPIIVKEGVNGLRGAGCSRHHC
jgi:divalent metal cation (Fe/Co/Zn/Cd) transporter